MAVSQALQALLDRLPNADNRGMYTTDIDKELIERTIVEIHAGGRPFVRELIDALGPPGTPDDLKPRYALHCLMNHVAGLDSEKHPAARRELSAALADALVEDARPLEVRKFLCEELAWIGREEAAEALGKALREEELCPLAAMALAAIGRNAPNVLGAAWLEVGGESRRYIIDAMAALASPQNEAAFTAGLKDDDPEVRLAAGAGLAALGKGEHTDRLLAAATEAAGWERMQAFANCLRLAEKLNTNRQQESARKVYHRLREACTGPRETHFREAAERGLAAIG